MFGNVLRKLRPNRVFLGKLTPVFGMLVVGIAAYFAGRTMPAIGQTRQIPGIERPGSGPGHDGRVVAYIYDTIPIMREELGEFLIARFGAERLEFLVNRKIVELECKAKGIDVTDQQIDVQLATELRQFRMTQKDFETQVLKRFNKSLYEWKEDVIRPKLMMAQLVEPTIQVTDDDIRKGFEGRYGPKVECRWVVLQNTNQKERIWLDACKNEAEFDRVARNFNVIPTLAANGGKGPPVHKHFGDPAVEKAAFNLKVGEISSLIEMPDHSWVFLKCDRIVPADPTKRLEDVRPELMKEIRELKLGQEISRVVADLRKRANPKLLLSGAVVRQEAVEDAARAELNGQAAPATGIPVLNKAGSR